jgi:PAS domain S-box-containing protein
MGEEQTPFSRTVAAYACGSWDWDIVADTLRVDTRFAELYGLEVDRTGTAVAPSTFFSRIHPDDRARMRIAVAGMLLGSENFSKEFRILDSEGITRWMHGRGQTSFGPQDEPLRFAGMLIDITERKRTEERLRVAQYAGGIGTFEYAYGFATVTVSDKFCRLLGLVPAQVLPVRTINNLMAPDQPPLIPERIGDNETELTGDFRMLRADNGQLCWIARRGEIVREGSSKGYRLVGVIYDISESKAIQNELRELNETLEARVQAEIAERLAAEEALRQAQKMEAVGQLTGGIAHDFNNLLTIISGNVETALRRLDGTVDPRVRRALEYATKGVGRAASLTQRLLAFSRRQPLEPQQTDIGRLIAGMTDLLSRSITEAIAIQIKVPDDLWLVEVDQNQLENAILNLAVNARDAMPECGTLTIAAYNDVAIGTRQEWVVVEVADTGVGMDAATLSKAFDPFFTTKEVGKGTGLGLSMVYGFAKQSNGDVIIQSEPHKGTSVRLLLPRMTGPMPEEARVEKTTATFSAKLETILVVEDDEDVRGHTVELLRELGYRVIEAHDGPTALSVLARPVQTVHLLITDVVMPSMSGRELADRARELVPGLRILFISGYPRDVISKEGRLDAGVELLAKPFTFASLSVRVRDLLERQ